MFRSLRFLRGPAALASLAVLAVACGGGGDDTSSGTAGGPSGDPIKIAAISGLSGGVSTNPEYASGADAAVKAINARGGIKGRPLELTHCDNHQNATDSAKCYRDILADKDIVAIAGGSDNYHDATATQIEAAKLPIIGQFPVSKFDLTNPLSFNVNGAVVVGFHGLTQDVVASGAKKVGLVTLDIPTADVIRKSVGDVLSKAGVEIVNNVRIAPSTADLSAPAQQVTQDNPDAVIWLTFAAQTSVAVKALRSTGYKKTVAFAGSAFNRADIEAMGAGGPLTVGLVFPPAWDTSTTFGKQFNEDMKAYSPDGKIDELSLGSWLGVQLFAQLAATLPTIDRASVLAGLQKMPNVDTGGLTPPISFADKSPLPYASVYNPAYSVVHVTDGKADWDGNLYEFGTAKVIEPGA
ncbi:ABC transporter substrate-binding protein [Frankia sp. CNm7]|uniref:ABC transporter substrate-binding protein n=1 Tax=Frankia nepalensis TaxID=1836974 RepID=A0A937RAU5_9ACTN|nr:ABC transporter substrate-binding protein [Frankia nepalensis]MBL7499269.1 ABC transporter substrate-binding protein [Frankia nepalensis]MBL7513498.1 ABC transporter substrate-binding protein [Frankia nepalensis]MBL7518885.1 ABC transporter substrate-binding protein [Frankia nepalensis]MBL7628773.1 ABC transporter substrate-binding protein [Frankia nepalensis]